MNVLVADDDDIVRLLLSSALTKAGHNVHQATNGGEAWDAWHGGQFPLVISDWMMPDLDGLEFCRRIRTERRADYTYVVLLTSRSCWKWERSRPLRRAAFSRFSRAASICFN